MILKYRKNVGTTDRIIRGIIATMLFISVIFSYCMVYDLMGCSTRKKQWKF